EWRIVRARSRVGYQCACALEHGASSNGAYDAASRRRSDWISERHAYRLRDQTVSLGGARVHQQMASGKEAPGRWRLRSGEADRLLHRSCNTGAMEAMDSEGSARLAAGIRGGGILERNRTDGSA